MEKLIKLNERDIIQVIADHFDVDRNHVCLKIDRTWEGYGPAEHEVYKISAFVDQK